MLHFKLILNLMVLGGKRMKFECKCGENIMSYEVFYEESGKFKAYYFQCPVCGCCQVAVYYSTGKVKLINGFKK